MKADSLEFLERIANAPSPSGYEEQAAEVYQSYTCEYADKMHTDSHGNVWAILNPNAEFKILLTGHIDEIGMIVHNITDDGMLHFMSLGYNFPMVLVNQRVWVYGKERVPGVIGRRLEVGMKDGERSRIPEIDELWIDIGARSKKEAERYVALGDFATIQSEFQHLLGDLVTARGCDDKVGAFAVAEALRELKEEGGLHKDVGLYAVATVQEELGLRGGTTASYGVAPKTGIAADVSFALDYPGSNKAVRGYLELGKGAAVMRGPNINPVVFDTIINAAEEDKIPYQINAFPKGSGTDANAMQLSRGGVATGVIGVGLRYYHSPCEMVSLNDVENNAKLLAAYCRRITPDTDFTPRIMPKNKNLYYNGD